MRFKRASVVFPVGGNNISVKVAAAVSTLANSAVLGRLGAPAASDTNSSPIAKDSSRDPDKNESEDRWNYEVSQQRHDDETAVAQRSGIWAIVRLRPIEMIVPSTKTRPIRLCSVFMVPSWCPLISVTVA